MAVGLCKANALADVRAAAVALWQAPPQAEHRVARPATTQRTSTLLELGDEEMSRVRTIMNASVL